MIFLEQNAEKKEEKKKIGPKEVRRLEEGEEARQEREGGKY